MSGVWVIWVGRLLACVINCHHILPSHSKPQGLQQALGVVIPWFLCCLLNKWNCPSNVTYLCLTPAYVVQTNLKRGHCLPWSSHTCTHERGQAWPTMVTRALKCETLKRAWGLGTRTRSS